MLKFGKLSGLEKLKTKFNGLNIIIERTVMHEMKEINREILDSEFKSNNCCQRSNSVSHNVSRNLIELYNSGVKIDINES